MKRYFITATDTGIGKTLVNAALAHQWRSQGKTLRALKPVISGFDADHIAESDTGVLLAAQGLPLDEHHVAMISPWRFAAPLSPDMAAQDEGKEIDFDALCDFCLRQEQKDMLLIEGVGGVMVPLNATHTVLDWMRALGFPVILVAGSALGTLSHTLLSARAIIAAGLNLQAVIISESASSTVPLARTQATLRRFLPADTALVPIARLDSRDELWKYVPNLEAIR